MTTETYSTVDRLSQKARNMFGQTDSTPAMLNFIIVLSAILSSIFFWQFSKEVFANVYSPIAILLGLFVGLAPSEGAYAGWRAARGRKTNLTSKQLSATGVGLALAVFTSMFSTFSLFVATVPFVPQEFAQYGDWLVFISLSVPVIAQFGVIAYYELHERSTVENFENAKLDAMGFDAYIQFEQARKMAIIEASSKHLENQIEAYANQMGEGEVQRLLRGDSSKSIGQQATKELPDTAVSPTLENSPKTETEAPETAVTSEPNINITKEETKYTELNFFEHAHRYIIRLEDGSEPTVSQEFVDGAHGLARMCANASGQKAYVLDRENGMREVYTATPDPKLERVPSQNGREKSTS